MAVTDTTAEHSQLAPSLGNPAVIGLAGFGMTTMMLQFHNLGWIGVAPVIWIGFVYGGTSQLIAGFQELRTGNNFGFCAFGGYGAFWIALCAYLLGSTSGDAMLKMTDHDLGFLLFGWTLFTAGLWIASFKISKMMWFTFLTLLLGFIGLDLTVWGIADVGTLAAWDLIVCALAAWYMMFHIVFLNTFGRDVLPVGAPLV